MAKFCGNCGKMCDDRTGLCPACDNEKINAYSMSSDVVKDASLSNAKNKKRLGIIAIVFILCVGIIIAFIVGSNSDSGTNNAKVELNKDNKLYEDLFEDLSVQYETVINGSHKFAVSPEDAINNVGWANVEGIMSKYVIDLDGDKIDEFIVVRVSKDEESRMQQIIDIYNTTDKEVSLVSSLEISLGMYCDVENLYSAVYIANIDGHKYICLESYSKGYLVDYSKPEYYLFEYSNGKVNKKMYIYNSYEGTDGYEHTMCTWDENGNETSTVLYSKTINEVTGYDKYGGKYYGSDKGVAISCGFMEFGFPYTDESVPRNYSYSGPVHPSYFEQPNFIKLSYYEAVCIIDRSSDPMMTRMSIETKDCSKENTLEE